MKLTLQEARNLLSSAGTLNLDSQENIALFNQRLNLVQERFLNEGKWSGTMQPVRFAVTGRRYITLPRQYVSALAMKYVRSGQCNGCYEPIAIQNQWYSYMNYGPWYFDYNNWPSYGYTRNVIDSGDGFVTFIDPPFARFYLRFTIASPLDEGKDILIKGLNEDLMPIFNQQDTRAYEGLFVTLDSTPVTTTEIFTKFTFAQKPITSDWVYVDAVDVDTGTVLRVANYEPSETTISYRRYHGQCPNWQNDDEEWFVESICKRRFVPSLVDTDEVYPANIGALQMGLMAVNYLEAGDPARYSVHMQGAYDLLNGEMREERGGAQFNLKINPASFQMARVWQGR